MLTSGLPRPAGGGALASIQSCPPVLWTNLPIAIRLRAHRKPHTSVGRAVSADCHCVVRSFPPRGFYAGSSRFVSHCSAPAAVRFAIGLAVSMAIDGPTCLVLDAHEQATLPGPPHSSWCIHCRECHWGSFDAPQPASLDGSAIRPCLKRCCPPSCSLALFGSRSPFLATWGCEPPAASGLADAERERPAP